MRVIDPVACTDNMNWDACAQSFACNVAVVASTETETPRRE
jgi:hypothetical protein